MTKRTHDNKTTKNKESKMHDSKTQGDFVLPEEWALFGPTVKDDPEPDFAGVKDVPAEAMWNRSFTVGAGKLRRGRKHRLVLRVTKENFGAGIWKPVGLMEQPSPARDR